MGGEIGTLNEVAVNRQLLMICIVNSVSSVLMKFLIIAFSQSTVHQPTYTDVNIDIKYQPAYTDKHIEFMHI